MATAAESVDTLNRWRLETPEPKNWEGGIRASDPNKYFIVSVDTHMAAPPKLFFERIEERFRDRLPRMQVKDGVKFLIQEGCKPQPIIDSPLAGEDKSRGDAGATFFQIEMLEGNAWGPDAYRRIEDQKNDGVDAEVIFANGPPLLLFASEDSEFVQAQARVWNDWVMEACSPDLGRLNPAAMVGTADVDSAVKEIERVAKKGFRTVFFPNKPMFGPAKVGEPNYNLPMFDPLWAAIQDNDLALAFHVSTGTDPRTARGNGGAIINYAVYCMLSVAYPVAHLCSSGVFERFPKLRVASIEANAGWIPFLLDSMDEAARKHHMWVSPKLQGLPSDYFRSNCYASFGEDKVAMMLAEEYGLVDNLMWANDYPHHEGSWPHSAEAIERNFGDRFSEDARRKMLGLNAAKVFRFDIPERYSELTKLTGK
ncbi:amidohydrolase family protein [Sphingobium sp.]|uniref:amidohydrolase family protein n=1 Tax=Sphingobium sp. TaxID=1912891 RepID=UPI0028BD2646|nr:amidohydrolase family protein [Sphingobium sp.]